MNIMLIIVIFIVLIWNAVYTVSYGIWTVKQNKKGGIALFILAAASVAFPLYLLWVRM